MNSPEKDNPQARPQRLIFIHSELAVHLVCHTVKISAALGKKKIGDIVREMRLDRHRPRRLVQRIPCSNCEHVYIGETGRGLSEQGIGPHRNAL